MSRKKLEAKFLVKITLDGKVEIRKDTIKNCIQDNVKGLKVKEVIGLKVEKDKVFADIKSNLHKLFFASPSIQESKTIISNGNQEEIDQNMINCAMALESQLKLQKALNPGVLKLVENIEALARESKALLQRNREKLANQGLRVSSFVIASDKTDEINSLKRIINNLEMDLHKLAKENEEIRSINSALKAFDSRALLEEMNKAREELQMEKTFNEEQRQKNALLMARIMAKEEEVERLKTGLANASMIVAHEEARYAGTVLKDLESKNEFLAKSLRGAEEESKKLKEANKRMEHDLVAALEDLSKFEGATLAKEQRKKRLEVQKRYIKEMATETQKAVAGISKSMDEVNLQQTKVQGINERILQLQQRLNKANCKSSINISKLKDTEQKLVKAEEIIKIQEEIVKDKQHCIDKMEEKMNTLTTTATTLQEAALQHETEAKVLKSRLTRAEEDCEAARKQAAVLKQVVTRYEREYIETALILQKVRNGFNKMYTVGFSRAIEPTVRMCEKVKSLVSRVKEIIKVDTSRKELVNRWKKQAEQLASQNKGLNERLKEQAEEILMMEDKLEEYRQQQGSLKQVIELDRKQEEEMASRIKELEGVVVGMEKQVKELEGDSELLRKAHGRSVEEKNAADQELAAANLKLQDSLNKHKEIVKRNENCKQYARKIFKDFTRRVATIMERIQEAETALSQRLAFSLQRLTRNAISGVYRVKKMCKESRERKTAAEAELMKLSLEQERIQMKSKKVENKNMKLEQQLKQYEVSLKAKNNELNQLNTKLFELTKDYKNEKAKATILEDYLQKSKKESAAAASSLKTQFTIGCKRIENFAMDKASHLLAIIQFFTSANRTLEKISQQQNKFNELRDKYVEAKRRVREMWVKVQEQEKVIEKKLETEQSYISQLNERQDASERLENELEEEKQRTVQNEAIFKARLRSKFIKLQESATEQIAKAKKDICSAIEHKIASTKHSQTLEQIKELHDKYKTTIDNLENDNNQSKRRLGAAEKQLRDKEEVIKLLNEELELSRETSEINKEEIKQLADGLNDAAVKLKETELQLKNAKSALAKCNDEIKLREEPLGEKAQMLLKAGDKLSESVFDVQRLSAELQENKSLLQQTQAKLKELASELMARVRTVEDDNCFGELVQEYVKAKDHIDIKRLNTRLSNYLDNLKSFEVSSDCTKAKLLEGEMKDVVRSEELREKKVVQSTLSLPECQCEFLKIESENAIYQYKREIESYAKRMSDITNELEAVKRELKGQVDLVRSLSMEREEYKRQIQDKANAILKLKSEMSRSEENYKASVQKYQREIVGIRSFIEKSQTLPEAVKKGMFSKHNLSVLLRSGEKNSERKLLFICDSLDGVMKRLGEFAGKIGAMKHCTTKLCDIIKEKDEEVKNEKLSAESMIKEKEKLVEERDLIVENMKSEFTTKIKEIANEKERVKLIVREQEAAREQMENEYKAKIAKVNNKLEAIKDYRDQWNAKIIEVVSLAFKELARDMSGMLDCKLASIKTIPQIEYKIFTLSRLWSEKHKELVTKHLESQASLARKHAEQLAEHTKQLEWKDRDIAALRDKCEQLRENRGNKSSICDFNAEVRTRLSQSFLGVIDQKREVETLTEQLKELKKAKDREIKELVDSHKKELSALKGGAERKSNAHEMEKMSKELHRLKQEVQAKENLIRELQDKEQKAIKAIAAYKNSTGQYKQEISDLKYALASMTSSKDETLTRLTDTYEKEIEQLNSLKAKAEQSLKQRSEECDRLAAEKEKVAKELGTREEQLKKLKEESSVRAADLMAELKAVKEKCGIFLDIINRSEEEAALAKRSSEAAAAEVKSQLAALTSNCSVVKKEYEKAVERLKAFKDCLQGLNKDLAEAKAKINHLSITEELITLREKIVSAKNKGANVEEVKKYLNEVVALCNEFRGIQQKRVEVINEKLEKVHAIEKVAQACADNKSSEGLEGNVAESMALFPCLQGLDLKNNFKDIAACILRVGERKAEKGDQYKDELNLVTSRLAALNSTLDRLQTLQAKLN